MSTLLVQNIKHTNGTTAATVNSSGVFASAGHAIQTVYSEYETYGSSTSTSAFSIPVTATITPKFSTSKILVQVSLNGMYSSGTGRHCIQELYKDIGGAGASSVHRFQSTMGYTTAGDEAHYGTYSNSYHYYETAGSTSSIVYQIYLLQSGAGTVFWNNYNALNGDTKSTMVLQEIKQ